MIQASLNGPFGKEDHIAVPVTPAELADEAAECAAAGARSFHVHARTLGGVETLAADIVELTVAAVKRAQPFPVGVGTGAWIEGNTARRLAHVSGWRTPDFASVNVGEDGALEVIQRLSSRGVAVEAGVWTVDDAELLVRGGYEDALVRVLVEPVELDTQRALDIVGAIHEILDRGGITTPRLQHGDGEATWVLLEDAVRRGIDVRVGFEDTFTLPDGSVAQSNAELVRAAVEIVGR